MELVTGKAGRDHVLSEQAGSMHAGIFGTGTYVLGTGSKLAATMVNSNTVRIADGDLMMQGRHCTIAEGQHEDLTVQNGTQNQRRSDLVVARYERLAEEPRTESVELKVVKGEPSDGEPEDPEIEDGDILGGDLVSEVALYRIPLDGISVGDPEPLFDLLSPMSQIEAELDEVRDSVSQSASVVCGSCGGTNVDGAVSVTVAKPSGKSGLPYVVCSVRVPDNADASRIFGARVWSIKDDGGGPNVDVQFRVYQNDTGQWTGRQGVRIDYLLAWR